MLQGLRYMHREMKQVHRDLKPANVLLTSEGVVKLSDFGVSKQLENTGRADAAATCLEGHEDVAGAPGRRA